MSRRYGMIHRQRALDFGFLPENARESIVAAIMAGDVIPTAWPDKSTYFSETTYSRGSTAPSGCTGDAPTVTFLPGLAAWRDTINAYGTRWQALLPSLLIAAETGDLGTPNFFQRFLSGNAGYDRRQWKAGWFDAEALALTAATVEGIGEILSALDAILKPDGLPNEDFTWNELKSWDAGACGTQSTLETWWRPKTDLDLDVSVRMPLTAGAGQDLLWEAAAGEYVAKAAAASAIMAGIIDAGDEAGETISSEVQKCWELFRHGSQTDKRAKKGNP